MCPGGAFGTIDTIVVGGFTSASEFKMPEALSRSVRSPISDRPDTGRTPRRTDSSRRMASSIELRTVPSKVSGRKQSPICWPIVST